MTRRTLAVLLAATTGLGACAIPTAQRQPSAAPASLKPSTTANPAATGGYDQTLSLQGVSFRVSSSNAGSLNQLRIEPKGLKGDQTPVQKDIDGTVTRAEVADLNGDGSPEIYVSITSAGSGSYGSLAAYAVNKGISMTEIFLPPLQDDPKATVGYMGHDEFAVVEGSLIRRFPIYRDQDGNARPTGGTRQVQYKLKAGEAGWVLRPYRVVDY